MHASQIQGCVVEQRVEKKRKIAESVRVHNVVTVRTDKVAGQCAIRQGGQSLWNVFIFFQVDIVNKLTLTNY